MTVQFLVYVITTLFTYIAGKVSKHFGWNYDLPITVQNIIIIAIASIVGCLIHIENLGVNDVITACLLYTSDAADE